MILMIDNYDSFTYNVVQYIQELGFEVEVARNDKITVDDIKSLNPDKIIISPGPATPKEAGVTLDVIRYFSGKIPIFGICLGHQSIAEAFNAKVIRAKNLMHGKTSTICLDKDSVIFNNIPKEFVATRYHSLIVDKNSLNDNIIITSYSADDNEIMSLEIKNKRVYGVQFHPESIMSEYGKEILNNFLLKG